MRFIDFFAGIGGFRLGMEKAGHECVGHCEIDKYADRSYRAMHEVKENEWYADDITRVKPGELPEAECYCFGFPCQSFSIAGNRGGFEDTRGTLFFEVMRLAKERHPRILFGENVKGLLNHNNGRTFETIIRTMDELGYSVEWQLVNSRYHGVPQNRERVFIIGHFRGRGFRPILPITPNDRTADQLRGHEGGRRVRGTTSLTLKVADFRFDEGIRPRQEFISPCLCSSNDMRSISSSIFLLEDKRGGVNAGYKTKPKETKIACTLQSGQLQRGTCNQQQTFIYETKDKTSN